MQRSARVSGKRPMAAMTFGHQQENLATAHGREAASASVFGLGEGLEDAGLRT